MLVHLLACSDYGLTASPELDTGVAPFVDTEAAPAASDTGADQDIPDGDGLVTVTWVTPDRARAASLTADFSSARAWEDAITAWTGTARGDGESITFHARVAPGGVLRYSVEALLGERTRWSCESTAADEGFDTLTGAHTVVFETPEGTRCTLTPDLYQKVAGVADGCEAAILLVACP
jgi:hypothetical protein